MTNLKVCVGVPSGDFIHARFCTALLAMMARHRHINIDYVNLMSSRITQNRNDIVKFAYEHECTHLLFIDSDMVFPDNSLSELLAHDKDIACATATKREEGANNLIGKPVTACDVTTNKRLVEMEEVGMPFMLIKMSVFDKISKPYFAEPVINGEIVPEDYYFVRAVRKAGIEVWCDMGLTTHIQHLGIKAYKPQPVSQPQVIKVA